MKNKAFILLAIFCSCAAVNRSEGDLINLSEDVNNSLGDINHIEFAKGDLDEASLLDYKGIALEQFSEFIEQLKIAVDPTYDNQFTKTAELAVENKLVDDELPDAIISNDLFMSLEGFLKDKKTKEIYKKELYKVAMISGFEQKNSEVYQGRIEFHFNDALEPLSVNVYLLKVIKAFGSDEHTIWEIKFGYF